MAPNDRRQREREAREAGRLPPGQALTGRMPVLSTTRPPKFNPETWCFSVGGLLEHPLELTYSEFLALQHIETTADIHCVTRWSRLDTQWEGVQFRTIAEMVQPLPEAAYVLFRCMVPYSSNLPLDECMDPTVLFAHTMDGVPLLPEHGWPLRLVAPKLYFWKSAKWVNRVDFLDKDQLGFWEKLGYHNGADPWAEQRKSLNLGLRVPKRFR